TEDFDRNFLIKPFQKPYSGQLYSSNQNARIDRIESKDKEGGYNEEENRWHAPS
ncbi:15161_t:CDS:2, partial [Cetraspora pellucida]